MLVTIGDRRFQTLAQTKLLFGTLEYQHVGIDSHTHRQNDTGNTRKREHRL